MSQEEIQDEIKNEREAGPEPVAQPTPEPIVEHVVQPVPEPLVENVPEVIQLPDGSEVTDEEYQDYGEGGYFETEKHKRDEFFPREIEDKEWIPIGEYGESGKFFVCRPAAEGGEYASVWGEVSVRSSLTGESEEEKVETEEEKELRKLREGLIEDIRTKTMIRILIQTKNGFLQKKLVEHFRKRRMESVLKEDPKGLDLENKYLKRLYAFKEFKQAQENEIEELRVAMAQYETNAKILKEEVEEKLKLFMTRAAEVSLTLISSKTGKKLNEKQVNRLLRRLMQKSEEKGLKKLKYIKLKNLIEEKEKQLRDMECIGEGLKFYEYEQMKIDFQNYNDKIEEKDEELMRLREKTQKVIQQLAEVRERAYALEGDIELKEEKVYEVEMKFENMRQRLTKARKKRDKTREEYARLKTSSGLLTKTSLLSDFENTFFRVKTLSKQLDKIKKVINDKTKQQSELAKLFEGGTSDFSRLQDINQPSLMRIASKRLI